MQLTGAEIVIECMKEQGVDTIFGYPGGTILNIYDALYKHPEIRHVLTSHEQGASHAADGYARSTGKVGVCFATSGPGATNLVTGIATAYMDSVPMVAITCNVGTPLLGRDSFQEIDIAGVTMPITKHNFIVKDVNKLADTIRRAFTIAKTGRPGPVLVDITKDATANEAEYEYKAPAEVSRIKDTIKEEDVAKAVKMIRKCERPFILIGGGAVISDAAEEVTELAHKIQSPVCDTLMGKGAFSGEDSLYVGMLGMHGTKTANYGVTNCDLLITIGARFSDRVTGNASRFARKAKILQIDVDPAEINKNVIVDGSIIGDIKEVLKVLNAKIEEKKNVEWLEEIEKLRNKYPLKYEEDKLTGPFVIQELYRVTKGEAIVTTDVGQHQMWAAQYYKYKHPRTLLTSGGLGTMGYGLGACIGAKVANPDKIVANIAGDGCFRMNLNELATASRYNIPIIQIVINNHVLGMVRQWQTLFYGKRYSGTVLNRKTDFVKLAEAFGAKAERAATINEFRAAFEAGMKYDGPFLIDTQINMDEFVLPMLPPGGTVEDMITSKEEEEE